MKRNILTRITALITVTMLLAITLAPGIANAASPAMPPMPPSLQPASGGGGGGGGSGGSGNVKFEPFTVDLKTSDGVVIGNITATDYYSARMWAEQNFTVDNLTYIVKVTMELESVPTVPALDITAAIPDLSPTIDLGSYDDLVTFNVTRYAKGTWVIKPKTVNIYVTVPQEALAGLEPNTPLYLVKTEPRQTLVYQMNLSNNATNTYETNAWYGSQAPSNIGIYTLIGKAVPEVIATPTPAPANQTAAGGDGSNLFGMAGMLILGLVLGLGGMLLFANRARKG